MNAVNEAIQQVFWQIPHEILSLAFQQDLSGHNLYTTSIQHVIRERVIDGRVMRDCNMQGGTQTIIKLADCITNQHSQYEFTIEVPAAITGGRTITSALALGDTHNSGGTMFTGGGGPALLGVTETLATSLSGFTMPSESNLSIIGENVLLAKNMTWIPSDGFIRVMLSHDSQMSNLNPRSVPVFMEMVALATKAYVYNTCVIRLDAGYQVGGVQIGALREQIDSYADANREYQDILRERWGKVAMFSDPESFARSHRHLIRPY